MSEIKMKPTSLAMVAILVLSIITALGMLINYGFKHGYLHWPF